MSLRDQSADRSPPSTALTTVLFDYSALTPADADWLRTQTAAVRFIARRSAEDVILLGKKFNEVRDRLGHGRWQRWVTAEFAWSYETARRFCRAATVFGAHVAVMGRFDPSALHVLSAPSAPAGAPELAVQNAEAGVQITQIKAREILGSCRSPTVTIEDVREVEVARRAVGLTESAGPEAPAAVCLPCDAFRAVVDSARSVRIVRYQDADNTQKYTATVYPDDDGAEIVDLTFDDLGELLVILAGREPTRVCGSKTCPHGGRPQGLYQYFTRNRSKMGGRSTACRDCERSRVRAAKKKAKG